jgi:hypothetical protein
VQERAYDDALLDLPHQLVAVSLILGVDFPELPVWKEEAAIRQARIEQRIRELRLPTPAPARPPPGPQDLERKPAPFQRLEKKVGRNDPCPCGSGKKFKKCCMNKT